MVEGQFGNGLAFCFWISTLLLSTCGLGMSDLSTVTVIGLQGRDVSSAAPSDGDLLVWNAGASEWQPTAPPAPAMEPLVGTPNTQSLTFQRIPFALTLTGTSSAATGISVNLGTGRALSVSSHLVYRKASSTNMARNVVGLALAVNDSGSVSLQSNSWQDSFAGAGAASVTGSVYLANSGSTVTVNVNCNVAGGASTVVDFQGYVDLMII